MRPTLLLALLLAATAPTQIFIVDATNGAGAHFTDLPAAVAATPDGATLRVKPGSYSPFTVTNKGLKIIGEGRVTIDRVSTQLDIEVRGTSPSQQILLRNLVFNLYPPGAVHLLDAAGPVTLEACRTSHTLFRNIDFERCRAVHFHACFEVTTGLAITSSDSNILISRSRLSTGTDFNPFVRDWTILLDRSRCVLIGSLVLGTPGAQGICFRNIPIPGDPGHGGIDATASTVVSMASQVIAGAGGPPITCQFSGGGCGGDGGPGVNALDSALFFFGAGPVGGPNGGFGSSCGRPPLDGPATLLSGQTHYAHDPTVLAPQAFVTGTQARGQSIQLTLEAQPATLGALLLSYSGLRVPFEPFGVGDILAQPALILSPFSVPASGTYQFPWQLPASLPLGEIYTGQFVNLIANGVLFASNPFPILATQ